MAAKKNEGKNLNVDASSSRVGAIPELIGLCRAIPFRAESSIEFDRTKVTCAADLPDYLMLGKLDHSACKFSKAGWSARWQGRENDTHFDIKYEAVADRYEIRQKWSGVDGGLSMYPARIPLGALISQSLYLNFPKGWDVAAKKLIESKYQVTYIEHPEQLPVVIGMPDGAMRAIAITLGAHQLRDFHNRLLDITARCRFPFPVMAYARRIPQVINYVEGKAPAFTTEPMTLFIRSTQDIGIFPAAMPERQTAPDGSSAWTFQREPFVVFVLVPFAGLTALLHELQSSNGPIRNRGDDELAFDMQPILMPSPLEFLGQNLSFWDQGRTTRSTWIMRRDGQESLEGDLITCVEDVVLASEVINAIEQACASKVSKLNAIINEFRLQNGE